MTSDSTSSKVQATASVIACVLSLAALGLSYKSNKTSEATAEAQKPKVVFEHVGVRLQTADGPVDTYQRYTDADADVVIPPDAWAGSGSKVFFAFVSNPSQTDAPLIDISFAVGPATDAPNGWLKTIKPLATCGRVVSSGSDCPDVIAAYTETVISVDIPNNYVDLLDPTYRTKGIVFCLQAAGTTSDCKDSRMMLPSA